MEKFLDDLRMISRLKCNYRVATTQGKQGIWFLLFPDRENTGNLVLTFSRQGKHREFGSDTGKNLLTQGKYLDCDY